MPTVEKKVTKMATKKLKATEPKKQKKQSLKKIQKTAEINAAKKLAKLKSTKGVSDKLNRAPMVKKQKAKHQFEPTRLNRGVVLIQNLPKGFFETQLKKYFSQYGLVTRLRLARSERTGGSKGYAYVEFKYPDVAQVAAESMNGYLMFRQRLTTVYIPPDQQKYDYFKQPVKFVKTKAGKTKLITPTTIRAAKAVKNYNKPISDEAQQNRAERSKYKLKFLEKKLAKAGINIDLSDQLYTSESVDSPKKVEKSETITKKVKNVKESTLFKSTDLSNESVKSATTTTKKKKDVKESKLTKVRKNFVTAPTPSPPSIKTKNILKKENATKLVKKVKVSKLSKSVDPTNKTGTKETTTKKKKDVKDSQLTKIRKNFVTAPTPSPPSIKNKKKLKK